MDDETFEIIKAGAPGDRLHQVDDLVRDCRWENLAAGFPLGVVTTALGLLWMMTMAVVA